MMKGKVERAATQKGRERETPVRQKSVVQWPLMSHVGQPNPHLATYWQCDPQQVGNFSKPQFPHL